MVEELCSEQKQPSTIISQKTVRQAMVEELCSEQKQPSTIISQKTVRQAIVEELYSEQRQPLKQWSRSCAPSRDSP